jgi:hypothetical protein
MNGIKKVVELDLIHYLYNKNQSHWDILFAMLAWTVFIILKYLINVCWGSSDPKQLGA